MSASSVAWTLFIIAVLAMASTTDARERRATVEASGRLPRAKWGTPSFEDEACVICQYVVQRVQNKLIEHMDKLVHGKVVKGAERSSTTDPFAAPALPPNPLPADQVRSVAEAKGVNGVKPPAPMLMSDLSFEPSIKYKKQLLKNLRQRWGGESIVRYLWEDFLSDFCSQQSLPELYVPVCGMIYKSARQIMKLIFFGFSFDETCLMSKMCSKNSYFASPTAVHAPAMSTYWNNMRGPQGFKGGAFGH